jgi:hypothetical protein
MWSALVVAYIEVVSVVFDGSLVLCTEMDVASSLCEFMLISLIQFVEGMLSHDICIYGSRFGTTIIT